MNYFLPLYFIKIYDMRKNVFLMVCLYALSGCIDNEADPNAKIKECAIDFAEAYFNYDFKKAQRWVTPESVKWLQFAASNVSQEDIDLINEQEDEATVEVAEFEYVNDSVSVVTVEVQSFLQKDSIGKAGSMTDQATFRLTVVERDGKPRVRMEGLPRSERQSRD